jgi:hypothetical protein
MAFRLKSRNSIANVSHRGRDKLSAYHIILHQSVFLVSLTIACSLASTKLPEDY